MALPLGTAVAIKMRNDSDRIVMPEVDRIAAQAEVDQCFPDFPVTVTRVTANPDSPSRGRRG